MNFHRNYKGMEIVKRFQNTMKFAIIFMKSQLRYRYLEIVVARKEED